MSAPKTNVEKQEKDHKTPLLGMSGAVIFAAVLAVLVVGWIVWNANEPGEQEAAEETVPGAEASAIPES